MINHRVEIDGLYTCAPKNVLRPYETDLFRYVENKPCAVCGHKLDLSSYKPKLSKFDLLKQTETIS